MSARIALVTSDPGLSELAREVARSERLELTRFETAEAVLQAGGVVEDARIVIDQGLMGGGAFQLLALLRDRHPEAHCLLVSSTPTFQGFVAGLRGGAADVLFSPVDSEQFVRSMRADREGGLTLESLPEDALTGCPPLVGRHPLMKEVYRLILAFADSSVPVLITGETGTGKGVVARAIHAISPRREAEFRVMMCAGVAGGVLESEVFGHERGAFSGAERNRRGHLESVGRGTLMLDEIGDASMGFQRILLRVMEERRYFRVGGDDEREFRGRVIAATNRDLRERVAEGRFREDLMFRLDVLSIHMPPLRERASDVECLIDRFLSSQAQAAGRPRKRVSRKALRRLRRHHWPGNVRELEHCLQRGEALSPGLVIGERHIRLESGGDRDGSDGDSGDSSAQRRGSERGPRSDRYVPPEDPAVEEANIRWALELEGGHRERAARRLQMDRTTLWRRMRRYGIT